MRRIGLVLGAGGMAGQAYHAGVLAALQEETGWDPGSAEVVVGTSAGSIVAAMVRAGVSPAALGSGRHLRGRGSRTRPSEVAEAAEVGAAALAGAAPGGMPRLTSRIAGLVPAGKRSPGGIVAMIRATAGDEWPRRATWMCAVRRSDGRRTVFGRAGAPEAQLSRAVAASCAIPGYFAPVVIDGVEYVDGGAHSPTNLDLLAGLGLDLVIVSSSMSVARGAIGRRVDTPLRLLLRGALAREAFAVRRKGTEVLSLQPTASDLDAMGLNAMDPRTWSDVYASARASTRTRLAAPDVRGLLG